MTFRIDPAPTFSAKVQIFDGPDGAITLEFRHRTRDGLAEFLESSKDRDDIDIVMDIVAGWSDVSAEFSREAMTRVIQNYHPAALTIVRAYVDELTKARTGN